MIRTTTIAFVACLAGMAWAQTTAPYAGQETREIKALSEDQIAGLRAGAGLGYAKAAELNGLPGPLHVLEIADELDIDADTRAGIEAIFQAMQQQARDLGEKLIATELELDEAFASGTVSAADVMQLTAEISDIEGRLRAVHLVAHLETAPLLTMHQRMLYNQARGYGNGHRGHGHVGH